MICLNKGCNFFPLFCARCDFVHTNYLSDIKDLSKLFDNKDRFQEKKGAIDFIQEEFELEIQQFTRQLQDLKLDYRKRNEVQILKKTLLIHICFYIFGVCFINNYQLSLSQHMSLYLDPVSGKVDFGW